MRVLGIDPGSQVTGYGIADMQNNQTLYIDSGTIRLTEKSFFDNLLTLNHRLKEIITEYSPEVLSVENIFFSQNVRSALKLGHTRGVIIITALELHLQVQEFTPKEMKMAVVGNGNASKPQVRAMIQRLLNIPKTLSYDEADALGMAVCCLHRLKQSPTQFRNWKDFIKAHPEWLAKTNR